MYQLLPSDILGFDVIKDYYPVQKWQDLSQKMAEYLDLYSSEALKVKGTDESGVTNWLTPLHYNPYRYLANIHAMLLFGGKMTGDPVAFRLRQAFGEGTIDDATAKLMDRWAHYLRNVWSQNEWLIMLPESSRHFQVFGRSVIKIIHDASTRIGVRIQLLSPLNSYFVIDLAGEVIEAIIAHRVSASEAREYGYTTDYAPDGVLLVEVWDKESWEIKVGTVAADLQTATINGRPAKGPNPYRSMDGKPVTPFLYVDRMPFMGTPTSIIDDMIGLGRELNERAADFGEAILQNIDRYLYATDFKQHVTPDGFINVRSGRVINAGQTMPGSEPARINAVDPPSIPPESLKFLEMLEKMLLRSTHTAAVILGEDEGSQRSAETLAARALPTIIAIQTYRMAYDDLFHKAALRIADCLRLLPSGFAPEGVSPDDLKDFHVRAEWSPVLPKGAREEAEINQIQIQTGVLSRRTAIGRMNDVPDVDAEMNRILEEAKEFALIQIPPNSNGSQNGPVREGA